MNVGHDDGGDNERNRATNNHGIHRPRGSLHGGHRLGSGALSVHRRCSHVECCLLEGKEAKEVFTPSKPLDGFHRLVGTSTLPSLHGFCGYAVGSKEFLSPEPIARRRNGDTLFNRVKFGMLFKFFSELSATNF